VPAPSRLLQIALTLLLGLATGALCMHLDTPLPWMLGPLLGSAALSMAGAPLATSARLRNGAQWAIGTALGLYFTPQVLAQTLALAPWILAGALWALLLGHLFYRWLRHAMRGSPQVSPATAYFSAVIGGASEMANFAEREGSRVDLVAAAHSLRVMLVVVVIPFAYRWADLHGQDASALASRLPVEPAGLLLLVAATGAGAWLLKRWRQPNPWVLGALTVSLLLTATGLAPSGLPGWVSPTAQLLIGLSLGTRFTPDFLHTAPRWLAAVAIGTVSMMALSASASWGVARLTGLNPYAVFLGNSPGGIAEMCLTAKALQLGVPLVTAFHVVRYVIVLLSTGPIYRRWIAPAG
jgi:uncharacterized protein